MGASFLMVAQQYFRFLSENAQEAQIPLWSTTQDDGGLIKPNQSLFEGN